MQERYLVVPRELFNKLDAEPGSRNVLNLYGFADAKSFFDAAVEILNTEESLDLVGFDTDDNAQYGMYNGYISGTRDQEIITVSFSALATKQGNTIVNQQLLPMIAKRVQEDPSFLVNDKYRKIFLLSSYLRENGVDGGREVNRVTDDNNSLSVQVKCLNTMNFSVHAIIPVEGLDTNAKYASLADLSADIERLYGSNVGNNQLRTVELDEAANIVIGNPPKLEGNASKFFAIRMYAALMLNKERRYVYDLSRVPDADNQVASLKQFADYINKHAVNHPAIAAEEIESMGSKPLNTILYGPPGTGKTWNAINDYAKTLLSHQVGQQLSAEEVLADSLKHLTWWQVVLLGLSDSETPLSVRQLMEKQVVNSYAQYVRERGRESNTYGTVMKILIERSDNVITKSHFDGQEFFHRGDDSAWSITELGRQYVNDELAHVPTEAEPQQLVGWDKYYRVVTFHQSYSYEEFVEGIRPKLDTEDGLLSYEIKPGVFKEISAIASSDPENKYLLIIDEINRGNIAKIFGELITLLEDDKRERVSVILPYSQEDFTIPRNLHILGTMNTADRSIALLDIALRRRFEFIELMPDYKVINRDIAGLNLGELLRVVNEKISVLIDRDHQIGHSYFMKVTDTEDLHTAWYKKILPLIQEYFYNDWERLSILLNNQFIDSKRVHFAQSAEVDDTTLYSFKVYGPEELPAILARLITNEEPSSPVSL